MRQVPWFTGVVILSLSKAESARRGHVVSPAANLCRFPPLTSVAFGVRRLVAALPFHSLVGVFNIRFGCGCAALWSSTAASTYPERCS